MPAVRRLPAVAGGVLAAALVPALVACTSAPARTAPAVPSTAAGPPPLTASLEQSRDNANRHLLQAVLHAADAPVTVTRLQVRGGGFTEVPPVDRDDVVAAHDQTAFPVPYGTAVCGDGPAPTVVVVGTPQGTYELPVTGDALLPALRARECARDALDAAARLSFDGLARDGLQVTGRLTLTRTGEGAVTVTTVEPNRLFDLTAGALPLVLAPGQASASAPVTWRVADCNPHARIENKRTYVFPVTAQLAGAPAQEVLLEPVGGQEAPLADLLLVGCPDEAHPFGSAAPG